MISLENRNKEKNKKAIIYMIIIFVLLLILLSGYTFAKSINEYRLRAEGKVAEPVLLVESEEPVQLTKENGVGTYTFKVKNYDEDKVSEVDLKYYIEIIPKISEQVKYKLLKNGIEIVLNNQKTEQIDMFKMEPREDVYTFELMYEKGGETVLKDVIQELHFRVCSEQKWIGAE